jgi:hypothetical protein
MHADGPLKSAEAQMTYYKSVNNGIINDRYI